MHIKKIILLSCLSGSILMPRVSMADNVTMFVRHEVVDYAKFLKQYNSAETRGIQKKGGVYAKALYQNAENPNDVTVTHDFHSLDAAKAFSTLPELKAVIEKSGVKGEPTIWFTIKR